MAGAKKRYQATATMLVVRVPGAQGGEVYLRRGRLLPATVAADEIKRLLSLGLIGEATEVPEESGDDGSGSGSDD